jgi:hypothetical protein
MAAREMGHLHLPDALSLVVLYAATDNPRFDRAAVKWQARLALERSALRLPDMLLVTSSLVALQTSARDAAAETIEASRRSRQAQRVAPS